MISHGIGNVGALLPHDKPVTKGGSMATPTAAQKRMFAKMGIAMPDGSYYIRDAAELSDAIKAVGRGNADHDTIRKHIITRAKALHLEKQIPDNWNADGSEKSAIAHFGVKGMHWGQHKSRADLETAASNHEHRAAAHVLIANEHLKATRDLETHGVHSKAFANYYGEHAALQNPGLFQLTYGRNKAQAVGELSEFHRASHNSNVRSANRHSKRAAKLRIKASEATHSAVEVSIEPVDVLLHFGVKGMHWGVRRPGTGTPSSHVSADHLKAQQVHHLIKQHGVKAASNEDLQTAITRLNLEQQHARLVATPSRVDKGHNFVKKTLGITKTGIDVVNTVPPAIGAGKKVAGGVSTGIKVVRIVNKTRKGQNHMS